jgi:hypothetical protein
MQGNPAGGLKILLQSKLSTNAGTKTTGHRLCTGKQGCRFSSPKHRVCTENRHRGGFAGLAGHVIDCVLQFLQLLNFQGTCTGCCVGCRRAGFSPAKCRVCTGMFHQIQGVHRIQEQGVNDWWWFVAAKGTKIKVSTHLSSILMAGCLPLGLASGCTDIQDRQAATPVRLHKLGLFDEQSSVCVLQCRSWRDDVLWSRVFGNCPS